LEQLAFVPLVLTMEARTVIGEELLLEEEGSYMLTQGSEVRFSGSSNWDAIPTDSLQYYWTLENALGDTVETAEGHELVLSNLAVGEYNLTLLVDQGCYQSTKQVGIRVDQTVQATQMDLRSAIKVYPNPTDGILQVELLGTAQPRWQRYHLYNSEGVMVQSGLWASPRLDISTLAAGVYVLHLYSDKEQVQVQVVKQ
jgi:hypothetical protein